MLPRLPAQGRAACPVRDAVPGFAKEGYHTVRQKKDNAPVRAGSADIADTSAMTALGYRVKYGESALSAYIRERGAARVGVLVRLAALALGEQPEAVASELRRDPELVYVLERIKDDIYRPEPGAPTLGGTKSDEEFDELDLLATSAAFGLDAAWWREMPVMFIASVVSRIARARSGEKPARRLDGAGVAEEYGISAERLERAVKAVNEGQ